MIDGEINTNEIEEDEQQITMNDFGKFLEDLREADPEISEMLDNMLDDYDNLLSKDLKHKKNQQRAVKKYFSSEKGKIKNREANKRYYYKNKTTTRPVGRPRKIKTEEN